MQSGPQSGPPPGPGQSQLTATLAVTFPIAFTTAVWSFNVSFALANISTFKNPFGPFSADPFGGTDTHWDVVWPPSLTQAQILLKGEDWDTYYGTFYWRATGY